MTITRNVYAAKTYPFCMQYSLNDAQISSIGKQIITVIGRNIKSKTQGDMYKSLTCSISTTVIDIAIPR